MPLITEPTFTCFGFYERSARARPVNFDKYANRSDFLSADENRSRARGRCYVMRDHPQIFRKFQNWQTSRVRIFYIENMYTEIYTVWCWFIVFVHLNETLWRVTYATQKQTLILSFIYFLILFSPLIRNFKYKLNIREIAENICSTSGTYELSSSAYQFLISGNR